MSAEHQATLIDGKAVAAQIRAQVAARAAALAERGVRAGLAAVLVGDNPASHTYVRMKRKACAEVGIESFYHELPKDISPAELEALIDSLNARSDVTASWCSCRCPLTSMSSAL